MPCLVSTSVVASLADSRGGTKWEMQEEDQVRNSARAGIPAPWQPFNSSVIFQNVERVRIPRQTSTGPNCLCRTLPRVIPIAGGPAAPQPPLIPPKSPFIAYLRQELLAEKGVSMIEAVDGGNVTLPHRGPAVGYGYSSCMPWNFRIPMKDRREFRVGELPR